MKKITKIAVAAVLAGASLSASAWWGWGGPWSGGPWGYGYPGYAYPAYGYAPVYGVPAYGYGHAPVVGAPWGAPADPFGMQDEDFFKTPEMPARYKEMMEQSEAEREQAKKLSEARMAAAQKKAEADKAAMDARRQAWQDEVAKRAPIMGMPAPFEAPAAPVTPAAE